MTPEPRTRWLETFFFWEAGRIVWNVLIGYPAYALLEAEVVLAEASDGANCDEALAGKVFLGAAFLANLLYSLVYVAERFAQARGDRPDARAWRWLFLLGGGLAAGCGAMVWAESMASWVCEWPPN